MKTPVRSAVLATAFLAATALFAYEVGGAAYTKRIETKLLAEPKPLAGAAGKLGFGHKLKVEEVQGAWLRVSEGDVAGWVFAGNLSDTKPADIKGADGLGLSASTTTATAAARPLSPAALEYATSRNLATVRSDFDWMVATCAAFSNDDVDAYLKETKRGEYMETKPEAAK
ncbi:MAG TPA: hypothetical protein VG734_04425 [Lacunisphaera sp.]|nr:hypothetical protein [Lacunisphaera sp.]